MFRFAESALDRELLALAASYRADGFAIGDLLRSAGRRGLSTSVSEVTRWLDGARQAGVVADLGYEVRADGSLGARRYRLIRSR